MGIIIPKITLSITFTHTRNRALEPLIINQNVFTSVMQTKSDLFHGMRKEKIKGVNSRTHGNLYIGASLKPLMVPN